MISVIGVSFYNSNRIYYFLPDKFDLKKGDKVIVDTEKGLQFGLVVTDLITVSSEKYTLPLKNVIRIASSNDEDKHLKNANDANAALNKVNDIIAELSLDMKVLNCYFTFDRKQLLFNFLADDRIDFRELVKRLASIYKTRIELRQIGVRDKAKEISGYGQCGRKLCCSTFLEDLNSVSINMAKNQNLALNPSKINGVCGRLLCCLEYENDLYSECKKGLPKVGDSVVYNNTNAKVVFVDVLTRSYKIELLEDNKIIELKL